MPISSQRSGHTRSHSGWHFPSSVQLAPSSLLRLMPSFAIRLQAVHLCLLFICRSRQCLYLINFPWLFDRALNWSGRDRFWILLDKERSRLDQGDCVVLRFLSVYEAVSVSWRATLLLDYRRTTLAVFLPGLLTDRSTMPLKLVYTYTRPSRDL